MSREPKEILPCYLNSFLLPHREEDNSSVHGASATQVVAEKTFSSIEKQEGVSLKEKTVVRKQSFREAIVEFLSDDNAWTKLMAAMAAIVAIFALASGIGALGILVLVIGMLALY